MARGPRTHGEHGTPLYNLWKSLKYRCTNPHDKAYKHYGARGIAVYAAWASSYATFAADIRREIGEKPEKDMSLDRMNSNLGYQPGNVRWSTQKTQMNNMRRNKLFTYDGETRTVSQWADHLGMPYYTLYNRLCKYHWTIERALTAPIRRW